MADVLVVLVLFVFGGLRTWAVRSPDSRINPFVLSGATILTCLAIYGLYRLVLTIVT